MELGERVWPKTQKTYEIYVYFEVIKRMRQHVKEHLVVCCILSPQYQTQGEPQSVIHGFKVF